MYDNIVEYWVTIRETGSYEEEHELAQVHKSTSKACFSEAALVSKVVVNCFTLLDLNCFFNFYLQANEAVKLEDGCFDRIKAAMPSGDAPMSDGSKPGANTEMSPEQQNAEQDWGLPVFFDVSIIPLTRLAINLFSLPCRCLQNKQHLKRYLDSLLRLSTKLKALRREMKDHYTPESTSESKPYYTLLF